MTAGRRNGVGRGQADPEPGEEAGTDVDCYPVQVLDPPPSAPAQLVDGRHQHLGVALSPRQSKRGYGAIVRPEGAGDTGCGGLDGEELHGVYGCSATKR